MNNPPASTERHTYLQITAFVLGVLALILIVGLLARAGSIDSMEALAYDGVILLVAGLIAFLWATISYASSVVRDVKAWRVKRQVRRDARAQMMPMSRRQQMPIQVFFDGVSAYSQLIILFVVGALLGAVVAVAAYRSLEPEQEPLVAAAVPAPAPHAPSQTVPAPAPLKPQELDDATRHLFQAFLTRDLHPRQDDHSYIKVSADRRSLGVRPPKGQHATDDQIAELLAFIQAQEEQHPGELGCPDRDCVTHPTILAPPTSPHRP